jgi:hypothetical protein
MQRPWSLFVLGIGVLCSHRQWCKQIKCSRRQVLQLATPAALHWAVLPIQDSVFQL